MNDFDFENVRKKNEYLVEERKVIIEKPEFLYKSLSKFNNPSKAILSYLDNLSKSNASYKENLDEFIDSGLGDVVEESFKDMLDREISSSNTKAGARIKKSKGKNPTESSGLEVLSKEPLSNSNSIKSPVKNQTILLNVTGLKPVHSENIWGSRFRQKI